LGSIVGGVVGNRIGGHRGPVATIGGAVLGGIIGHRIIRKLDRHSPHCILSRHGGKKFSYPESRHP